jgi:hypothetical protein
MTCGIKKPNKPLRITIGIVILFLGFYFESYFGFLGLIPIMFALSGYCPLCAISYKLSKLN